MSSEPDDEFLNRVSHNARVDSQWGDLPRLIALARRGLTAREDALEEAAMRLEMGDEGHDWSPCGAAEAIRTLKNKKP
jgi:hypothetical protein